MSKDPTVFDYVDAITEKKPLPPDHGFRGYAQRVVMQAMSLYPDTVPFAQMINRFGRVPDSVHFAALEGCVEKRRRRSKWPKRDKEEEVHRLIREEYCCTEAAAVVVLDLMGEDGRREFMEQYEQGGRRN